MASGGIFKILWVAPNAMIMVTVVPKKCCCVKLILVKYLRYGHPLYTERQLEIAVHQWCPLTLVGCVFYGKFWSRYGMTCYVLRGWRNCLAFRESYEENSVNYGPRLHLHTAPVHELLVLEFLHSCSACTPAMHSIMHTFKLVRRFYPACAISKVVGVRLMGQHDDMSLSGNIGSACYPRQMLLSREQSIYVDPTDVRRAQSG